MQIIVYSFFILIPGFSFSQIMDIDANPAKNDSININYDVTDTDFLESYKKRNSVSLEVLGHNLFYSINYERKIGETATAGIGGSYANVEEMKTGSKQTESVNWYIFSFYYNLHSKKLSSWYFEPAITISSAKNPSTRIWFSPGVGYKYQMRKYNWWVKTGAVLHIPGLLIPVLPWLGLRIGYSF